MAGNRTEPRPAGYGTFSLIAGVLLIIATGVLAPAYYACGGRGPWWRPIGIARRATLGVYHGWMLPVAVRLWVLAGRFGTP